MNSDKHFEWNPGEANPKQRQFLESECLYTAYGGAKGGGKTWAIRTKALLGAYSYDGIKILIMRRSYPELQSNHIEPMLGMIEPDLVDYNGQLRRLSFYNGSIIRFGHWSGDQSELEYNGQEYDWIFLDEATQFSWRTFQFLGGLLRGANKVPKRLYLCTNPGGVGHRWFKRLFIDRDFITDKQNEEENENPDDYVFIPATIEDNKQLLESSPNYLRQLSQMPENLRNAYRYGIWEDMGGNYFPEFSAVHIIEPFKIPAHWQRYRSIDYGLDMLSVLWFAVDEYGNSYLYREYHKSGLITQEAAQQINLHTLPNENISITFAPPDIWNRQKDSGKTMAEIFFDNKVPIVKADNNRVQGHMLIKEAFALKKDGKPSLQIFDDCTRIIEDIKDIQADDNNPNDCAKEPHDVTHSVDALRYYCISRITVTAAQETEDDEYEDSGAVSYDDFMLKNYNGKAM